MEKLELCVSENFTGDIVFFKYSLYSLMFSLVMFFFKNPVHLLSGL